MVVFFQSKVFNNGIENKDAERFPSFPRDFSLLWKEYGSYETRCSKGAVKEEAFEREAWN